VSPFSPHLEEKDITAEGVIKRGSRDSGGDEGEKGDLMREEKFVFCADNTTEGRVYWNKGPNWTEGQLLWRPARFIIEGGIIMWKPEESQDNSCVSRKETCVLLFSP